MKAFFAYLRERRRYLAALLCFVLVFALSFLFCRLPLRAVLYPLLLCLWLGAVFAGLDFLRLRRRRRQLEEFRVSGAAPELLPPAEGSLEGDYQAVIRLLLQKEAAGQAASEARYADMIDYYSLWAHQIKVPIASMHLSLEQEDSAFSRRLTVQLNRIEQYVEMVLAFLRLGSSSTDYVIRECSLDAVVRQAVRKFAGEFIQRRIRLLYEPSGLQVLTDEKWLGFVLEQLLSNALKYTPSGSIRIYAEAEGILCIQDSGIGIAPEDLPRVFEKGYTGYNGRLDQHSSGIGLYLCRSICTRLGHGLSLRSLPGEGTTARLDLRQGERARD